MKHLTVEEVYGNYEVFLNGEFRFTVIKEIASPSIITSLRSENQEVILEAIREYNKTLCFMEGATSSVLIELM